MDGFNLAVADLRRERFAQSGGPSGEDYWLFMVLDKMYTAFFPHSHIHPLNEQGPNLPQTGAPVQRSPRGVVRHAPVVAPD